MIVYLVWMHQHYEPSYLMSIHANKEKSLAECADLTSTEDNTEIWYDVKEEEVIE